MGMFGKSSKKVTTDGYMQPADALPVATLVTDETMPPPSAPLNPSGDGCPLAAAMASDKNNFSGFGSNDPTVTRFPMMMTECPNCQEESRTRVITAPTWKTWAAGGCLFFVFWPICWMPLVVDSCKETEHFCVKCGAKVAKVEAFQDCCVETRG
eukprot:CAMPEP_0116139056 /NCGR_PEP_ID=MMETSP0329-20121206/13101_1 /TAXON_ID=697910 /ORGANISM="Pseudo-nitzschia arenysensis, Strain B593" /LENGTH=153 /DNA_ID=CAMNT_0003634059 /DNA_START=255 /DNA_END=719 /DNA_ORIENTATION=+